MGQAESSDATSPHRGRHAQAFPLEEEEHQDPAAGRQNEGQ